MDINQFFKANCLDRLENYRSSEFIPGLLAMGFLGYSQKLRGLSPAIGYPLFSSDRPFPPKTLLVLHCFGQKREPPQN